MNNYDLQEYQAPEKLYPCFFCEGSGTEPVEYGVIKYTCDYCEGVGDLTANQFKYQVLSLEDNLKAIEILDKHGLL